MSSLFFLVFSLLCAYGAADSTARFGFLYTRSTVTYQSSCQAVLVPADAVAMQVVLYGGSGGRNRLGSQSRGGRGGGISSVVPAVAGVSYFVCIGGKGSDSYSGSAVPGYAGWPGGGYAQSGGGGGGFTSLQTSSDSTNYGSRIVVAAGGGGGGYQGYSGSDGGGLVGAAAVGAFSQVSSSMALCCTIGAKGGTQVAGGAGGGTYPSYFGRGEDGRWGPGGSASSAEGGGGGGGYYGGGGGAKAGGAGGSNYAKDNTVIMWNAQGATFTVYVFGGADIGGNGNATITFLSSFNFPISSEAPTTMPSPLPTATRPSPSPTPQPSREPTPRPSSPPTTQPSPQPSPEPTPAPSPIPTTATPTAEPTPRPSALPSPFPSPVPTPLPSPRPSSAPPTALPSAEPTNLPSAAPNLVPTKGPTSLPTMLQSPQPSRVPTPVPSAAPTTLPTMLQSPQPSRVPTAAPTPVSTMVPTLAPTKTPTILPSASRTVLPTTLAPTASAPPIGQPTSAVLSLVPTLAPTGGSTAASTDAAPMRTEVTLVLSGMTLAQVDAKVKQSLRVALQLTLGLHSVDEVGEPSFSEEVAVPARPFARRSLLPATPMLSVEFPVTLPSNPTAPSSPSAAQVVATQQTLLSLPSTETQFFGLFKASMLPAPAPAFFIVSGMVVAATASPSAAPTTGADLQSDSNATADAFGGQTPIIIGAAGGAALLLIGVLCFLWQRKKTQTALGLGRPGQGSSNGQSSFSDDRLSSANRQRSPLPTPQPHIGSVYVGYDSAYSRKGGSEVISNPVLSGPSRVPFQSQGPFRSPYMNNEEEEVVDQVPRPLSQAAPPTLRGSAGRGLHSL